MTTVGLDQHDVLTFGNPTVHNPTDGNSTDEFGPFQGCDHHSQRVIGVDFTPEMLEQARRKLHRLPSTQAARIEYRLGDAMALELDDRSVDVVSIAFGIRNVADPEQAVGEFARVLRPGGRLVILEFDRPRFGPLRWFNDFYCGWFMPRSASSGIWA